MKVGQLQAHLLGHPVAGNSSTTATTTTSSSVDPRFLRMLQVGEMCRRLRRFAAGAGHRSLLHSSVGQYQRAFCRELDGVLDDYSRAVLDLSPDSDRPAPPAEFEIKLSQYLSVMPVLDRLIAERTTSQGGCALLDGLHRASFCGEEAVQRVIARLQRACHSVLFQYIAAWTVHGRLVDNNNEFFIRPSYSASGKQEDVFLEESLIPSYLSLNVCRQILFIGKVYHLFTQSGSDQRWKADTSLLEKRLLSLSRADSLNLRAVEDAIGITNRSLTAHFSRWLLHHADLPAHLSAVRNYFLLGNGELYHRFLEHAQPLFSRQPSEEIERDVNKLWKEALSFTSNAENQSTKKAGPLMEVRLVLPRAKNDPNVVLGWDELKLACTFSSSLGMPMLFTDEIMERYNQLFRFLLRLRRVQMSLEQVWVMQKRWKVEQRKSLVKEEQIALRLACLLRLEMAFLTDGLMHYIQDVIEVEFEEMCRNLAGESKGGTDVEEVVSLHENYLRKLATYCAFSQIPSIHTSLTQIFALAQAFANFSTSGERPTAAQVPALTAFLDAFRKHQHFVVDVLSGLVAAGHKGRSASGLHFSGLLLRFQSSSSSPFHSLHG